MYCRLYFLVIAAHSSLVLCEYVSRCLSRCADKNALFGVGAKSATRVVHQVKRLSTHHLHMRRHMRSPTPPRSGGGTKEQTLENVNETTAALPLKAAPYCPTQSHLRWPLLYFGAMDGGCVGCGGPGAPDQMTPAGVGDIEFATLSGIR